MRVAHPLPRRRGNHTFVNALPWMCRAGAPWRGLPECCGKWVTVYRRFDWVIVPDCTVPTRYGKWVTVYRRFDRWSGNSAMERLFTALREERVIGAEIRVPAMDSTSAGAHRHAAGAPKRTPGPSASLSPPPGAEHGRTRLQPHEALPQGRHPLRQARRAFLADLRLILIAVYLKKHSQKPTSVNTP